MRYEDIKQDTPRLVVTFQRPAPDQENFQWGIAGSVPLIVLIGKIVRVQADLPMLEPGAPEYAIPESALVISWDGKAFHYLVHPSIPVDSMIGMLEMVKMALITSQAAQQARNQQIMPRRQPLLGPDGQPMRG